jgi:hypothetical protein
MSGFKAILGISRTKDVTEQTKKLCSVPWLEAIFNAVEKNAEKLPMTIGL